MWTGLPVLFDGSWSHIASTAALRDHKLASTVHTRRRNRLNPNLPGRYLVLSRLR